MSKTIALIVAAGRGHRLGGALPKQYLPLAGITVLRRTVQLFQAHPGIQQVRVVIHPDDALLYAEALNGIDLPAPIHGGATRQDSVRLGLEALAADAPDSVLIQDAARPFADAALIDRVLDALADHPGAIPAIAVADTLKRAIDGRIETTVPRTGLYRAQTPQGFRFADILAAHRACAGQELTDDASVLEAAGQTVVLVEGAEANVKITTAEDMMRAETLLGAARESRSASGFDVHRFAGSGDHVTLCGVSVPHDSALEGHSDADVGLHALTDALLGCIGAGDIGQHFPPSDPQWRGASSDRFLAHARSLVEARGGRIVHVDVTLICERPKIGPYRDAMVARVAEILRLSPDRVSVKATTTEQLGFTGRREGIAAQALATIELPR
ncbi:MAG: bifunctional 2-C-methyl-D-erythritol 4-phosphate cytidylyltransferase/2-C-methyl-D-erythritol 2,4-cyclodiphosphate synthase [Alphaproteobacteria bacterium]|nr:bifunctional 2-C-methyl-D-erythritol 4-phosphate cytidylyltransferase/2-C-methyl-D-erythritol 2,4-cyclodiphosphate synthase [Alphaproteobacteria bacterium]MBU0887851.1 bifunctional 2-C-methyl-D-erythritol 4-phosphate cytidylyltransferase/2-C-methyl-D-erythritol 2,4-cyclodiphosphate synthase [Alphaproteobacteria bacterium]MBU1814926.1 bifunctional 2-C-methyl-D-erythritol 4-phosphate cytidylyltransferase/2-C-methyl-D-erythritol 2,4-cyclodiphosphate synthase [Alphaproteobacteria bacterium]